MITQNQAKIFLSKNRGVTNKGWIKSYAAFKETGNGKPGLGVLYNLKDDVLGARKTLTLIAEEDADFMLLPLAGTIIYKDSYGNSAIVEPGKVEYFRVKRTEVIKIFNPYNKELVNFLYLWLKPGNLNSLSTTSCFSFEKESNKNKLLKLFDDYNESAKINFFIGKFDGRQEILYNIIKPGNCLFFFVIEGAFEVQYRLLETRDALALWDIEAADIESLSNNAVVLIAEFSCEC